MEKSLLYFGCIGNIGHYLWLDGRINFYNLSSFGGTEINTRVLQYLDGTFTPSNSYNQGAAMLSNVGKLKILAWHDYTVDKRSGSNSVLIGLGYESAEEMLEDAKIKFPSVMNRQTEEIKII